jgi:tRNA1(Val) A37 N6-methylase TrmN6
MAFRSTEITVREVLLDELRNHNVSLAQELSFPLPSGRKGPDAILSNGADYVLETKMGTKADYWEDIKKLTQWMKIPTAPIAGAFAVLIPKDLRKVPWEAMHELAKSKKLRFEVSALFRDERPADQIQGSLSEVADWIAGHVLQPPTEITPDTNFVVNVLSESVRQLSLKMRGMNLKQFEDIFGGDLVFDNILEIKPNKLPIETLRRAASYLFINQILFYGVLSKAEPGRFPRIETNKLSRPIDLLEYFRKVLEVDYAPTFGFDIASRLSPNAIGTVKTVVDIIQAMGLASIRHDILGKVFHNLIPLSIRKPVAAYYTSQEAADLLAALAVKNHSDHILDPACGSGTLLVSCYQQKRRLLEEEKHPFVHSFNLKNHTAYVSEDITGIDIMPFAAHLAVVHLSIQTPRFATQKVRVAVWDSTELKPHDLIPSLTRELARAFKQPTLDMFKNGKHPKDVAKFIKKGSLTAEGIGGQGIKLSPVDVVIMNPPFTSSDRLGADYKKILKKRFAQDESLIKGKINFQGHFLILGDKFLKKGGRLAAVLPQTTFTGESFKPIVNMFVDKYRIKAIIVGLGRSAFSENTALSEVLFVAEKGKPSAKHSFALVGTKKSPDDWKFNDIQDLVTRLQCEKNYEDDFASISWINQKELLIERGGLTRLLPRLKKEYNILMDQLSPALESKIMIPYSSLEKKSKIKAFMSTLGNREAPGPDGRGGVYFGTSALNICREERRALKKVDRLIVLKKGPEKITVSDRVSETIFDVPKSVIVPCVRRLSLNPSFDVSNSTDFIISKSYPGLEHIMKTIYGEEKSQIFIGRIKERWSKRVKQGSTQLCLARRIDLAASGTNHIIVYSRKPSFTGHGGWGFRNISDDDAKLLCLWFNSSLFIVQLLEQRTQTRGTWWRLDKHRFARTLIPDLTTLSQRERRNLIELFEELRTAQFPSLLEQFKGSFDGRKKLDAVWLTLLGIDSKSLPKVIKSLHHYIYNTLNYLLGAMSED